MKDATKSCWRARDDARSTPSQGRPHIPWAYPLDDAPQLPLTGEQHPLRRETRPLADLGQSASRC